MGAFRTTPDQLVAHGGALGDIERALRTELGDLTTRINRLLGEDWNGGAARGFGHGWADWHRGAGEALDALRILGSLLGTGGHTYTAVEGRSQGQVETTPVPDVV